MQVARNFAIIICLLATAFYMKKGYCANNSDVLQYPELDQENLTLIIITHCFEIIIVL